MNECLFDQGLRAPVLICYPTKHTYVSSFYDPYPKYYHLEVLGTSPDHRCKGAASALVKKVTDEAVESDIFVSTEPGAQAAGFYRKLGLSKVGQLFLNVSNDARNGLEIPTSRYLPQLD